MQIISGQEIAQKIRQEIKQKINQLGAAPGLAVILVGADPASHLYVSIKEKVAQEVGINLERYLFFATTPQQEIIQKIEELNQRKDINGIIVQLPLPAPLNKEEILNRIDPKKDIDGFLPENMAKLKDGKPYLLPVPIQAVMKLIEASEQPLTDKKALIISNSRIFATPLKILLRQQGALVEWMSSQDENLTSQTGKADILVVASGQPKSITADEIKDNAIVIDVGTSRVENQTVGDIDQESLEDKPGWLAPSPGGVGPLTVAYLMANTLKAFQAQR